MKKVKRIALTGGGGQIAYSLIFRICSGEVFGADQPISLSIHDVKESCEKVMPAVVMELEDSAYPLLREVKVSSDPNVVFKDADIAILVGAKPRGPGMERKDLLLENGVIFKEHGKALNEVASRDVLVFVVGNPCNTNCLIAMRNAPDLSKDRFHAMTRLDQNRAQFQLAQKASAPLSDVTDVIIWGNHSTTQVPDYLNAKIKKKPALEAIKDLKWLQNEFINTLRQRGASVIKLRGKSSAASATEGIISALKDLIFPKEHKWFSSAICSDNNPYGIKEGLIFSFPLTFKNGKIEIVKNLHMDNFLLENIRASEKELLEEKALISHLLK